MPTLTIRRAFALALVPAALSAQALDRTQQPPVAPKPATRIPTWTTTTLANGAKLVVSVKRDLPLVAFSIGFIGGAANFEPAAKPGVGSFTAQMLSEGTATLDADALSNAQQALGITINANIGQETGSLGFQALSSKLDGALALVADMLLHPTFPEAALERIRGRTLVSLQQARDNPNAVASNVFARVTYGEQHPYGRVTTEASVKAITRDDIVAFHKAYYTPGHAVISVVGDVDPAAVKASVERALAAWPKGGAVPRFDYPAPPAKKARAIYLVDKPKAAQSVFQLGHVGPARATPDYFALEVVNTALGGLFQSRLNHDIREEKGYSYGVGSRFDYGRGPGAFRASGGIVTAKSDSALLLFMKHIGDVRGPKPLSAEEVAQAKDALVQSLPQTFAGVGSTRSAIAQVYLLGLGEDYWKAYAGRVAKVSNADLLRAAKAHIDLDQMNLVIVGDRAVIEKGLRDTKLGPIVLLDADAKPVVTP